MSSSFGLVLSLLGWFAIPDTPHLRPWVIGVGIVALLFSSYRAWEMEFNLNRTLYGRPDIVVTCRYRDRDSAGFSIKEFPHFELVLKNTSQYTAVNIYALQMRVQIPERIRAAWEAERKELQESSGHDPFTTPIPSQWIVSFDTIDVLAPSQVDGVVLHYRIHNSGPLQQCLSSVLSHLADVDTLRSQLQLTVVFSNLGTPVRTWHAHHELRYYLLKKADLTARFVGFGAVPKGKVECPLCTSKTEN